MRFILGTRLVHQRLLHNSKNYVAGEKADRRPSTSLCDPLEDLKLGAYRIAFRLERYSVVLIVCVPRLGYRSTLFNGKWTCCCDL
jgi:hypothetical protein